jgi:hypothetical protein
VKAVPDAAASRTDEGAAPQVQPPANSTAMKAAISTTASAGPSTPNTRPVTERLISPSARIRPVMVRGLAGSAPSASAGSRSVPISRARICRTPSASGSLPPVTAQAANGTSSATLSVRW